ncbi:hypothetical protein SDRG_05310, partial [Saprolegnia diclina VS20]
TTSSARRPDVNSYVGVCSYCKGEYSAVTRRLLYAGNESLQRCSLCGEVLRADIYFKNAFETIAFDVPLRNILASCPQRLCRRQFSLLEMLHLHLRYEAVICSTCGTSVAYETHQLATFIREHPGIDFETARPSYGSFTSRMRTEREIPIDGLWSTYLEHSKVAFAARVADDALDAAALTEAMRRAVAMIRAHDNGAFPIDLVRAMHRDLRFVA